jgi:hypothetical protein
MTSDGLGKMFEGDSADMWGEGRANGQAKVFAENFNLIFWGRLPLEVVFILSICKINLRKIRSAFADKFNFWYLEVFFHWKLSSFQPYLFLVWSSELMFKIWGWSNQWFLRYSTFYFWGLLPLEVVFISSIFGLRSKIYGRSYQRLLRYLTFIILRMSSIGGRLPLEVVFHWRLSSIRGCLPFVSNSRKIRSVVAEIFNF